MVCLALCSRGAGLLRRADRSGFAAVLVDDDLRLFAVGAEAGFDEVHFGLHHGEIVLRAALQDEARAERGEIRDAGDIEEDILRAARRRDRRESPPTASPAAEN